MKVCINCSWAGQVRRQTAEDTMLLNLDDGSADFIVDFSLFSPVASKYPPEKRAFATGEPSAFMNYNDGLIAQIGQFYRGALLTWHPQLARFPQTIRWPFGTTWVTWDSSPATKKFGIGGMFSAKSDPRMHGYQIRRKIEALQNSISLPGTVFNPTGRWKEQTFGARQPSKVPSLEWMFHFAVENCAEAGYFTEKIMDCFMTYSAPVYYGDPEISKFFDMGGIIVLDENHIAEQVNALTPEKYQAMLPYVIKNEQKARSLQDVFGNIMVALKKRTFP